MEERLKLTPEQARLTPEATRGYARREYIMAEDTADIVEKPREGRQDRLPVNTPPELAAEHAHISQATRAERAFPIDEEEHARLIRGELDVLTRPGETAVPPEVKHIMDDIPEDMRDFAAEIVRQSRERYDPFAVADGVEQQRRRRGGSAGGLVEPDAPVGLPPVVSVEALAWFPNAAERARLTALPDTERQQWAERLYEQQPQNIEELAWQISVTNTKEWGVGGAHPILKKIEGSNVFEVDQTNFLRWVRERMIFFDDLSPDSPFDFTSQVRLNKQYRPLGLGEMLENMDVYFKSSTRVKDGKAIVYSELVNQIMRETWLFGSTREKDIKYRQQMGSDEELPKVIAGLFWDNMLTKTVWGKSSEYWIATMPEKAGMTQLVSYLAYYNITDLDKLQGYTDEQGKFIPGILDQDAPIFTREGFLRARMTLVEEDIRLAYPDLSDAEVAGRVKAERSNFISDSTLNKIFDANGKIKDKAAFVDFINVFSSAEKDTQVTRAVRRLLRESVTKKLHLYIRDEQGQIKYETNKDGSLQYQMQIDENGDTVYEVERDAQGQPLFEMERDAQGRMVQKKDRKGNPIPILKKDAQGRHIPVLKKDAQGRPIPIEKVDSQTVNFGEAFAWRKVRVTGAAARNDLGGAGYDAWAKIQRLQEYRKKQMSGKSGGAAGHSYTVHALKKLGLDFYNAIRTETKEPKDATHGDRWRTPLEVFNSMADVVENEDAYRFLASQLVFPENTMRQLSVNHIARAFSIFHQVIGGNELHIENFTKMDPLKGVIFEKAKFMEAVQEKFIKAMRYAYSTWGQLDFSQEIRSPVLVKKGNKEVWEYRTMSIAESMFGIEMVDIPEFWKREYVLGSDGKPKLGKDGKPIVKKIHEHVIDPQRIQDNKAALWKQMAKLRIAAEIFAHKDLHSTDAAYDWTYYEQIIAALETIPGGVLGDETSIQSARPDLDPKKRFFGKDDIEWIRKKAKVTKKRQYSVAGLKQVGKGLGTGLVDFAKKLFDYAAS